jgi:hypothetical protein
MYYDIPPGGVSRRGATPSAPTYSTTPWARAAQASSDMPPPGVDRPGPFTGTEGWGSYNPSDPPQNPAKEKFTDIGADVVPPDAAPVPVNIVGGGEFDVAADFDGGIDVGEIPPNIVV